jgi:hypothetical protein
MTEIRISGMGKQSSADEKEPQHRVTLDPDIAIVLTDRSTGKKRGYSSRLVNRILRERFIQLGWIKDELAPDANDE